MKHCVFTRREDSIQKEKYRLGIFFKEIGHEMTKFTCAKLKNACKI